MLVLREIGREGPSPVEVLHDAPRFWLICSITRVLPGVGIAMRIAEDRCRGETYCVRVVSGGFDALCWYCTVGALAVP